MPVHHAIQETLSEGLMDVPGNLPVEEGEVHVWVSSLKLNGGRISQHELVLSPEEIRIASGYRREEDRSRYIVSHGILRSILSRYVAVPPNELVISIARGGKPYLQSIPENHHIQFSLSHSSSFAAIAIARSTGVGVDIECVREVSRLEAILARYLSDESMHEIAALPEDDRRRAFFRWWTANEALLKAQGKGIGYLEEGLDFVPREGLLSPFRSALDTTDLAWSLWTQDVEPDNMLAVVAEGEDLSFQYRDYSMETDGETDD